MIAALAHALAAFLCQKILILFSEGAFLSQNHPYLILMLWATMLSLKTTDLRLYNISSARNEILAPNPHNKEV